MKASVKNTFATLAVTALSLGAITTATTFASSDAAYAKSEKSNGKSGESRGKSREARGKSGSKGKSADSSANKGKTRSKQAGSVEKFFAKLTGKETRPTKPRRVAKVERKSQNSLHPSELGNMNGALNANVNAVIAHIRNGNTNGPVGHIAALAAASASAEGAQEILDRAALFVAIENSEYATLEEYYLALEGVPGNPVDPEIEAADDKDLAASEAGFDSHDQYLSQLEIPPAQPNDGIDGALDALGINIVERGDAPSGLALDPADPKVVDAEQSLVNQTDAEDRILAYWNKNPDNEGTPETGRSEAEEQLLSELQSRFSEEERAVIQDAVESTQQTSEPGVETCDDLDESCEADDEIALATD